MKKDSVKIAAAIDIGPESVNMKIAQQGTKEQLESLEFLSYPTDLGEESFSTGEISFLTADKVADILNNYFNLAKEYQIPLEYIKAIGTTALRDASNKEYVLDQMQVKTDRKINIIEDAEEKNIIFREMLRRYRKIAEASKSYLMVYTGTGSVGVAAVRDTLIVYSQNVKTDTLKLTKMTEDIESLSMNRFTVVIEEYLNYTVGPIRRNLKNIKTEKIVASGEEIDQIQSLCLKDENSGHINKEKLLELFMDVSNNTSSHLEKTFGLSFEKSKKLLVILAFYIKLMEITGAKEIVNVKASIVDALLYNLLYKKSSNYQKKEFDQNMLASARFMAEKYELDKSHSSKVEEFSLIIFDNLRKVHGFSRRERLYLQTAAILHDIGKYVDSTEYDHATVHIINNSFIIGLNTAQKEVIANIARYHGNETPNLEHRSFEKLTDSQKMTVSKLSAILRLADALDYSRLQKISDIKLKLNEKKLSVIAHGDKDTTLEEWTFKNQSIFFEKVFGIKCEFIKKGLI